KKKEQEQKNAFTPAAAPQQTEQEVTAELAAAQLDTMAMQKPSAETMRALGAVPGAGAISKAEGLGLMPPKKAVVQVKPSCPRCGNQNLARYGDYSECAPCGWNSRMTPVEYLVETGSASELNVTFRQLPRAVAMVVEGKIVEGYHVARVYGDAVFFEVACRE